MEATKKGSQSSTYASIYCGTLFGLCIPFISPWNPACVGFVGCVVAFSIVFVTCIYVCE
jgi:hypothetical protein